MIAVFAIFGVFIPFIIFVVIISVSIESGSKKRQINVKAMGECLININSIIENKKVSPDTAVYLIEKELRELDKKISLESEEQR